MAMDLYQDNIIYHLYIENHRDLQFEVQIRSSDTFRTIIEKILNQIESNSLLNNWKPIAAEFPRHLLRSDSHPLLHLQIYQKMVGMRSIEDYIEELLTSDSTSISLNTRHHDIVWRPNHCLFIIVLAVSRYPESISTGTRSTVSTTASPQRLHALPTPECIIIIDDDDEDPPIAAVDPIEDHIINQNQIRSEHKPIPRKRKKKAKKLKTKLKSKSQKKKQKKRAHKTKKRSKNKSNYNRNHNTKRRRRARKPYDDGNEDYEFSDTSGTYDDEFDILEEEAHASDFEDELDDLMGSDEEEFEPPSKRRKMDLTNISAKLKEKQPTNRPSYSNRLPMARRGRFRIRIPRLSRNQRNKESPSNHMIILLDSSRSMNTSMVYTLPDDDMNQITRYDLSLKYIRKHIQNIWPTRAQSTTSISFATFGQRIDIKGNQLKYSVENVKKLVKIVLEMKSSGPLSNHTAVYDSILQAIQRAEATRRRFTHTRILIFTDGENWSMRPKYNEIKMALKSKQITVDCIQTTRSERDNTALRKMCVTYSNHGRYWNPLTLDSWDAIFDSIDFLYPAKRNRVFDLTMDEEEDEDYD
eukprot:362079_1